MGMTEQQTQLVIEAQKGDIKSFEELLAIYHEKVYALARKTSKILMLKNPKNRLPAVYAERTDLQERLGRIIDGLSDVQRQAIALYYFNELSVDEISDVMECSANTVKTWLFLARKAIRTEIEEQECKSVYSILKQEQLKNQQQKRGDVEL